MNGANSLKKLLYQRYIVKYVAAALENRLKPHHCQLIILLAIFILLSLFYDVVSTFWNACRYYSSLSRPFSSILYFKRNYHEKMIATNNTVCRLDCIKNFCQ